VLDLVTSAIAIEKDAPDREERIQVVRQGINSWVAKYRRNEKFAGRPSYRWAGWVGGWVGVLW